jgi:hypothetical protein
MVIVKLTPNWMAWDAVGYLGRGGREQRGYRRNRAESP